jgi:hypothetical protein
MTIDEQVREYMRGWPDGVNHRDEGDLDDDYRRGYNDGHISRNVAEEVERWRLERAKQRAAWVADHERCDHGTRDWRMLCSYAGRLHGCSETMCPLLEAGQPIPIHQEKTEESGR